MRKLTEPARISVNQGKVKLGRVVVHLGRLARSGGQHCHQTGVGYQPGYRGNDGRYGPYHRDGLRPGGDGGCDFCARALAACGTASISRTTSARIRGCSAILKWEML